MRINRRDFMVAAGAPVLLSQGGLSHASSDPLSRPVKLIVPFATGGSNDLVGRMLAAAMQQGSKQAIVVENKGGAGGAIGAVQAARSEPDGHTLLLHSSTLVINQKLVKDAGYDYKKDFEPISLLTEFPLVLVVNQSVPVKNVTEFLEYAREKGDRLFYGSAGNASSQHLVGELFNKLAGTRMQHVPFRGNGPATQALMAGDIQVFFDIIPTALTLGNSGKVRTLAVTSKERAASVKDLPTLHETILPGFEATFWQGLFLPKKAKPEIVKFWHQLAVKALEDPEIIRRFTELGFRVQTSTPAQLATHMDRQSEVWGNLIRDAKIAV